MTDEEYVRSVWSDVWSFLCAAGTWYVCDANEELEVWEPTEAEAWSAAAAFTRERQEEIRQLEREIEFFREWTDDAAKYFITVAAVGWDGDDMANIVRDKATKSRTLPRLQRELDNLQAGMRAL